MAGTTVKDPEFLLQDLLADEKHTQRRGEKQYIAMTVAKECILSAAMTESASEASLTEAYVYLSTKLGQSVDQRAITTLLLP